MFTFQPAIEFLRGQPMITLFLAIGAGYLIGRIKVAGFSLGAVGGTLLTAIPRIHGVIR